MQQRTNINKELPGAYEAMFGLQKYVNGTSLSAGLKELIKIRASQVNGCAFCINMHTKEARSLGETEQRIYALNAWRETPYFTPEERSALALTEAVTVITKEHVPDALYEEAARYFDSKQIGEIIMSIVVINAWNRIAISTNMMPE
ncbi:carboxymuconolactone decarboxylase family protein [Paenibacillus arenilitoris]|uniref:Carboxymuconolactone decarboxylase family protein n=1 Tax=Paenibacillus arenilitoris TaxID=2772299 RepID=A0A927CHR1_9BACL|nr:carboxymuconolactone decarboxylase family protein [Paenibacillus arenilitoris]MBD2868318.1 carboxymuconolactone decarboxylase family protein [Paenibacillus arenilitoris]